MRASLAVMIILCGAVVTRGAAQVRLETGGGSAHLDQLAPTSLTSFSATGDAALGGARFHLRASSQDHFGMGLTGTVHAAAAAAFTTGAWHWETGPAFDAARDIGASWVRNLSARATVTRDLDRFTIAAGWQGGVATLGSLRSSWQQPHLSAEMRSGAFTFGATLRWLRASTGSGNRLGPPFADTLAATPGTDSSYRAQLRDIRDVGVRMSWSGGPLALAGHITQRFGSSVSAQMWWEGSAALHITPAMSLVFRQGRLASDVVLNMRGGRYTTLGLRLDLIERSGARNDVAPQRLVTVTRESSGKVRLAFTLPATVRTVRMLSDLTEWRAIPLERASDGRWMIVVLAPAGTHRINVSIDEGPWIVPPGLPSTDDGFGARVGLLVLAQP